MERDLKAGELLHSTMAQSHAVRSGIRKPRASNLPQTRILLSYTGRTRIPHTHTEHKTPPCACPASYPFPSAGRSTSSCKIYASPVSVSRYHLHLLSGRRHSLTGPFNLSSSPSRISELHNGGLQIALGHRRHSLSVLCNGLRGASNSTSIVKAKQSFLPATATMHVRH